MRQKPVLKMLGWCWECYTSPASLFLLAGHLPNCAWALNAQCLHIVVPWGQLLNTLLSSYIWPPQVGPGSLFGTFFKPFPSPLSPFIRCFTNCALYITSNKSRLGTWYLVPPNCQALLTMMETGHDGHWHHYHSTTLLNWAPAPALAEAEMAIYSHVCRSVVIVNFMGSSVTSSVSNQIFVIFFCK